MKNYNKNQRMAFRVSSHTKTILDKLSQADGCTMSAKIERLILSEAKRVGIGQASQDGCALSE